MKRTEKIIMIIIGLGLCWMTIKTIYGVGYAKGMMKANEEILIECEQRIDEMQDKCNDKIEAAKQAGREEILEQF